MNFATSAWKPHTRNIHIFELLCHLRAFVLSRQHVGIIFFVFRQSGRGNDNNQGKDGERHL
jgi:hypothetical protein